MKENQKGQNWQNNNSQQKDKPQGSNENVHVKTPPKEDKTKKNKDQQEKDEDQGSFNNENEKFKKKYDKGGEEQEYEEKAPSIKSTDKPDKMAEDEDDKEQPNKEREQPERRKEHEDYDHPHGSKIPTAPNQKQKGAKSGIEQK